MDTDGLDLCVVVKSIRTQFSANAGLLVSTEWGLVIDHVVVVDPDGTKSEDYVSTKLNVPRA